MNTYCSPLRYPGGKSCIFKFVSQLFYENNLIGINYAEPYAGGAGLALRLLFGEYVNKIYINDLDRSIYAFWKIVIEDTNRFCDWIGDVDVTMDTWYKCREIQRTKNTQDLFALAKSTFFLNRTNVSGVIKGGVIGGFEQKGNYKIDARFNKEDLIARINKISKYKKRIAVSFLDGIDFARKVNQNQDDVFIYFDPPYFRQGSGLYMNYYSKADHEKLSRFVLRMRKRWLVSYDNNEYIMNLYMKKRKLTYEISQSTSNRVGTEALIFCDKVRFEESVTKLNGATIY